MSTAVDLPLALTLQTSDLPYAHGVLAPGLSLQLYIADVEGGFMVVNTLFQPHTVIPTHLHTGAVHGFTKRGRWHYREYGDDSVNMPGSYIYEPAGSTHTLEVGDEETEVIFIIHGALVNYAEDGTTVASVVDAGATRDLYFQLLDQQGDPRPTVLRGGTCGYTD